MINKKSYIIIFLGIIGLLSFIYLRPKIDFFAEAPILESRNEVETKLKAISESLGFSMDSLEVYTYKKQHGAYFETLKDTLGDKITPRDMNLKKRHLHSWVSDIGKKGSGQDLITSSGSLFEAYGLIKFMVDNNGKVIRIRSNLEKFNPTFLKGNSPRTIAEMVVDTIIGYDLKKYTFLNQQRDDSVIAISGKLEEVTLPESAQEFSSGLQFKWIQIGTETELPKWLTINLEPVVREYEEGGAFKTEFGYKINSFSAQNEFEPENLVRAVQPTESMYIFVFFGSLIVLVIAAFSVGLKNIFKGKVEWRRALFMFATVGLGVYGWQAIIFMSSFSPFYTGAILLGSAINNLVIGVGVGAYMALAYVAWEALARSQKHAQLEVIDAIWQRKFFVREIGAGLIHGFAIGGVIVGLFAVGVWLLGLHYLQFDSQLGFMEPSSKMPMLTINMSTWTTTWLVVFIQIGFTYGLISHWVSNKWGAIVASILVSTIFVSTVGRLVATNGTLFEDYLIFISIVTVVIFTYRNYGILSVCVAWWIFVTFYIISPYWFSESIEVAYIAWVEAFIIVGPLIFGFIAYRFGIPVSEVGDYIPEYEERIAQHLRVEREIEIARESQYKLMPPNPPKADGFDVYGFFLPSFEVGGDYFDYVLSNNADGSPKALTMAVVDVSGKAMRAAMPAIFTSGLLLSRMKEDTPAQILSGVSEPIYSRTDKRTFITCAIARYNLEAQTMMVANAGHCKPILKRNGKADFIQTSDPKYPLGIRPEVNYQDLEFKLKKGDFFLLYSDGLPEATNEAGEWFGFDEVPALVERIDTDNLSANEIAQEIKRTVQKFSNYQLADDTTVICFKI